MPTTPIPEKDVAELRELLTKATPGPWAEDDLWNNDSGTRYRDSQIIASNPLHPSHMDRTITICDTLNAWHCFSEEDREANMKLICALYNAAPYLLALASQSQERDAESIAANLRTNDSHGAGGSDRLDSARDRPVAPAPLGRADDWRCYDGYNCTNWDGDGAQPILPETVSAAKVIYDLMRSPAETAPCADGTIGFEWVDFKNRQKVFLDVGSNFISVYARIGDRVLQRPTPPAQSGAGEDDLMADNARLIDEIFHAVLALAEAKKDDAEFLVMLDELFHAVAVPKDAYHAALFQRLSRLTRRDGSKQAVIDSRALLPRRLTPAMACSLAGALQPPWPNGDPYNEIPRLVKYWQKKWTDVIAAATKG